ncbi:MAG: hypothetical protein LBP69_09520 [Treponema sp.]|jgi:hypothetical protein|nr:hypothetical protein [Treponema sp.]
MMTRKEAKELSLEVWRYLAEHPALSLINNTYVSGKKRSGGRNSAQD